MPPKKGKKKKGGKKKKVTVPEGVDAANVVGDYKQLCASLNVDNIEDIGKVACLLAGKCALMLC